MSEISWSIELPKKKQAVLGQAKPKAKILLETEVGGTEEFFVPTTVARALQNKEKDGVFTPSSRNEFLYELKEISPTGVFSGPKNTQLQIHPRQKNKRQAIQGVSQLQFLF